MSSQKDRVAALLKEYGKHSSTSVDQQQEAGDLLAIVLKDGFQETELQMALGLGANAMLTAFLRRLAPQQGAGSRVLRPAGMTEESLLQASRYIGFIEVTDQKTGHSYRTAAVVCSSRHIATYQHGDHKHLNIGHQVQVCLPATHQVISTQVVLVEDSSRLDCIILAVQGKERLAAPELRPADRGEAYTVLGQSCKKPSGFGTYGHGHIASTRANKRGHILGDTLNGKGDWGAGVFSLDGGYLLGMCVGRDAKYQKTVIVPASALQALLTSLDLSEDELSDMDLDPNPTYDSD